MHSMEQEKLIRVGTGIPGFDNLLQGGIPFGTTTLLSGACGTGKSTFAMQFLYNGAKYWDEPGVYITLEEDPERLIQNMRLFGWDIDELIKKKKFLLIKPDVYKFDSIKQIIGDAIDKIGAKRLVVDSYSVLLTYFDDPYEIRNGLVQLDREIKKMECTTIVISDIKDNSETFSTTGVEEFIVDGVIVLYMMKGQSSTSTSRRAVFVRKMRATKHPLSYFQFDITRQGIVVSAKDMAGVVYKEKKDAQPQAKKAAAEKPGEGKKKSPNIDTSEMVDVQSLRSKGHHSWKWKHL
jgi:KaiC/GvpD/RAD55 family RecA-like ATPase